MTSAKPQYCFFVSSVVKPWDDTPYTYGVRTRYSAQERTAQTLQTIKSIREHCPKASIIFVEGGAEYSPIIARAVDKYVYAGKYHLIKNAVSSRSKAWGEVWLTLMALPYLRKYDYFWKISGRYYLNDKFNDRLWISVEDKITGLDIYGDCTQISTRLIGVPRNCFGVILKAIFRRFWKLRGPGTVYEAYMAKGIGINNINFISPIGVSGFVASVNGLFIEE